MYDHCNGEVVDFNGVASRIVNWYFLYCITWQSAWWFWDSLLLSMWLNKFISLSLWISTRTRNTL